MTDKRLHDIIIESVRVVLETAKIKPWSEDERFISNPDQTDVDFAKLKRSDDIYNQGKKKNEYRNTGKSRYGETWGDYKKEIEALQNRFTKEVQDRYMADTGRKTPRIPKKELGKISGSNDVNQKLKNGMDIEIKGKTFAFGNTKLPENIMIVNLTSAWNCPSLQNGECPFGDVCYAKAGENRNTDVQLRNLRNQFAFKYLTTREILELLEKYIENAPARIKAIRISEDGDFPDQKTLDFCDKLAGHLMAKYGILTTAYTHRHLDYSNIRNIVVNASSYAITNPTRYFISIDPKEWAKVPDGLTFNIQEPIKGIHTENGVFKCNCDCRTCGFCYKTKEENGEPQEPITVVECLRGGESSVQKALKAQEKMSKKTLKLPACAAELN